jgi:peptidoglycan-N-acetylglucosamine deacetylase
VRPRGYRSPAWEISSSTLGLLEELGFDWDSSLMANDLYPYRPRSWSQPLVANHGPDTIAAGPAVTGRESALVEVPVSWYLDDFPTQEFIPGKAEALMATAGVEARWRDTFDFASDANDGAVYCLTLHPQTAGRPHMIRMLERLIIHMRDNGAEFLTISEVVDATVFDEASAAASEQRRKAGE